MTERNPYDGRPFYCDTCGAGFLEYIACDAMNCRLERPTLAESRRLVFIMSRGHGEHLTEDK